MIGPLHQQGSQAPNARNPGFRADLQTGGGHRARVSLPLTCGELVQGWHNGAPVLVSCPIDCYVTADVELLAGGQLKAPAGLTKARRALRLALERFGPPRAGARLHLTRDLPAAKGYGTSTADIAATIVATARAAGIDPSPAEVAAIAVQIEPTDSTIFPGLTAFDHRSGGRAERLGEAPALWVAIIDLGGTVDTIEYNRRAGNPPRIDSGFAAVFDLLWRGIRNGRPDWIGEAATRSAELHQTVLPKPALPDLIGVARQHGGLGVVVAHSGTLVGLLTVRGAGHAKDLLQLGRRAAGPAATGFATRLVGGGWRPATSPPTELSIP